LHDILKDLAIYQSTQEQTEQIKRLMIGMVDNEPERWLMAKQQGILIQLYREKQKRDQPDSRRESHTREIEAIVNHHRRSRVPSKQQ